MPLAKPAPTERIAPTGLFFAKTRPKMLARSAPTAENRCSLRGSGAKVSGEGGVFDGFGDRSRAS
ncbi:hypothetical protein QT971_23810 [Microcoleus sp. herbarium19]